MKKTSTMRSLLFSALSLLVCASLLIGTTFAWFTDSVTSANNIIKSGNLDVELEYYDAATQTFKPVTSTVALFDENALWEPGYTEVAYLKISNLGSLALKYNLDVNVYSETAGTNVANEPFKLSDHLVFKVLPIEEAAAGTYTRETAMAAAGKEKGLKTYNGATTDLLKGESDCVALVIYMPTDVDNVANYMKDTTPPSITMGVNLSATQYTYEEDSFDKEYDEDAVYAEAYVSNTAELDAALKAGATEIALYSGDYTVPASAQGKTLKLIGAGDANINLVGTGGENCDYGFDGSTVTFENITFNTNSSTYIGFARCTAIYNDCTFNGTYTLHRSGEFNNCEFNVTGDVYNLWTWGAPEAILNGCTFNSDGKAVLLYGGVDTKLTVDNCVFNDNGGLADLKAAIEIGNDYNRSYTLIVNNTVVNGYEINDKGINTGTTLWGNKNSMGTDKLNVIVDGVDVY